MTIGEERLLQKYKGNTQALAKAVLLGKENDPWIWGVIGKNDIEVARIQIEWERSASNTDTEARLKHLEDEVYKLRSEVRALSDELYDCDK